ncbi:hypothetical protein J2S43_005148 [Catenuloplanes nepalensis]|uniref:Uncharacterized protein n=1 Tax=Catenuloplanes nepalensis TaxID=587533 RepID=A0ABT9MZL3_9ACTN|nr:hypothetical protein [Catenuloplanes nepalensis]
MSAESADCGLSSCLLRGPSPLKPGGAVVAWGGSVRCGPCGLASEPGGAVVAWRGSVRGLRVSACVVGCVGDPVIARPEGIAWARVVAHNGQGDCVVTLLHGFGGGDCDGDEIVEP